MTSPVQELIDAIHNFLIADASVFALVENRIYDRVAEDTPFPYVTFNTSTIQSGHYGCIDLNDITLQIDVWSRKPGNAEAHEISNAIRKALDDADLNLSDNALCYISHDMTQVMQDPDGITSHAVIRFNAAVQSF